MKAPPKKGGDGKAGVFMASFNLSNAILGAGVGGMPFALKEAGFYSGFLLIIIVALSSDYSVRLLITQAQMVKKKYYEQLVQSQFGRVGYVAVTAAMGIFAYGAMCAYLIGIGDTMSIVASNMGGMDLKAHPWIKRVVLTSIATGAVLPLSCLKDMAKLSKTSLLSLCSVILITFIVVVRWLGGPGDAPVPVKDEDKMLHVIDTNFFPAIGVIAFAFVCHHACFLVYNTLRDNTEARWAKTVHISLGMAAGVMLVLAAAAYLTFRGIMNSNFLTNYSFTDNLVNFMRVMFALTQTLTYPLELFVARHAVHALFFSAEKFTDRKHYMITTLLWGSSLAIALNVAELGVVLELTGGVSAVFIGFVLPAMLHFKMTTDLDYRIWRNPADKRWPACKRFARSYWIFIFGILAMVFTVVFVGMALLTGGHAPHDAFEEEETEHGAVANTTVPLPDDDPNWTPTWVPDGGRMVLL